MISFSDATSCVMAEASRQISSIDLNSMIFVSGSFCVDVFEVFCDETNWTAGLRKIYLIEK